MDFNAKDFKKNILWKEGHRFARLKMKQSQSGKTYFQADLGNFLITSQGKPDQYGNLDLQFIPIKYEKIQPANGQKESKNKNPDIPNY